MTQARAFDDSEGDTNGTPGREGYVRGSVPGATRALLARDERVYIRQSLSTPCMDALAGSAGSALTTLDGRSILDFHGNSVHQLGHGHPRVIEAVKRQLDTLPFCPRRFTNEPAVGLAERLGALTGGLLTKVLLAPAGTLAVGAAMKLARVATGRFKFISMWGSFHGASLDTISVGGEALFRAGIGPLLPGCTHVPACAPSSCLRGCGGGCDAGCASHVEEALEREGDVAAVIAEPVRCTTVDVPPPDYWKRVREACDWHGALLIFDEIPTGLGRTGRMFSYEHFGVAPDILVLGKGLGGGVFPQAAMLARPELDRAPGSALGHYTHEKSPVGAAAALATLGVIADEGLVERSASLGSAWRAELAERLAASRRVRQVRGLGLLVGVELGWEGAGAGDVRALADRVLYRCLSRGLSFKVSDGRVLTLTPPLTVHPGDLSRAAELLSGAVAEG